tara:strand:+ start:381 stop:905 length:525 start_codon:yes stop_codon:yes gene_type:complete
MSNSQTLSSFEGARNEDFETPYAFVKMVEDDLLRDTFDLDVAASSGNTKAPNYYDKISNGLDRRWYGNVWCNPPYGRKITEWLKKCLVEKELGVENIFVLIPARTDVAWFHDLIEPHAYTIYLIRGRMNFKHHTSVKNSNAPFPSMLVHFKANTIRVGGQRIRPLEISRTARGF